MQAPVPTIRNESTRAPEYIKAITSIRNVTATAVNYTTIWTPAAGKAIRIHGIAISTTLDARTATSPQKIMICLGTTATPIWIINLSLNPGAFTAVNMMAWNLTLTPQGYLCPIDGVLKVWLAESFLVGAADICVYGGEE